MRVGLREKFLIPIVLTIILGMTVSALLSYWRCKSTIDTAIREGMAHEVGVAVKQMGLWLHARRTDLETWTLDRGFRDALVEKGYFGASARKGASEELAVLNKGYPYYDLIFLVDPTGRIVATSGDAAQALPDLRDRDYFKTAMAGRTTISDVIENRQSGRRVFVVSVPVRDGDKILGVLGGAVELSAFSKQFIDDARLGRNGYAYLTDSRGRIIYQPNARSVLGAGIADTDLGRTILHRRRGAAVYTENDDRRLATFGAIQETGWVFVQTMSLDEALAPAREMGRYVALIGLLVVLAVTLFVSLRFRHQIARRLNGVLDAIGRVQAGDLDARARGAASSDEVGVLAAAFNSMATRLKETLDSLTGEIAERKRAAAELRESEELLRATIESTADGLLVVNNDEQIISANARFAEMCGIPEVRVRIDKEENFLERIGERLENPAELRDKVQALHRTTKEDFDTLVLADGRVLEYYSRPLVRGGEIAGRVWSFRDVTERRRADAALQEARERLDLALRGADLGLWDWDLETGDIVFNDRWAEMLGYSAEDVEPNVESWQALVHPDDLPAMKRALNGHIEGRRSSYESEHRLRTAAGDWRWVLDRGRVVERDADGRPLRVTGTQLDITEWKWEKEALREISENLEQRVRERTEQLAESVALYQAIGDTIPFGVWIADARGHLIYASDSFLQLTGLSMDEAKRLGWTKALPEDDLERTVRDWLDHVRTGEFWDYELRIRGADEKQHIILSRGTPVRDKDGRTLKWVGLHLDITRLKQAEDELRQHHDHLEQLVRARTATLIKSNEQLQKEIVDRQRVETAMRESEERFRAIFEYSRVAQWHVDLSAVRRRFDELRAEGVEDLRAWFAEHPEDAYECARRINVLDLNASTLKLYHAPDRAGLLASLSQIFDSAMPQFASELGCIAEGRSACEVEATTHALDGEAREVICQWTVTPGHEQSLDSALVSFIDLTGIRRAEKQIMHLNVVLRSIRNVNQLITKERDRGKLVRGACELLTETRGYSRAWSVLYDEDGKVDTVANSGFGDGFAELAELLERDELVHCARRVADTGGVFTVRETRRTCGGCPASLNGQCGSALCVRLEHGDKCYGYICVSVRPDFVAQDEEVELLEEVAGDIAFACHSIDLEAKRRVTQEFLRVREQQLRLFVEHTPAAVAMFDRDMRYIIASRRWKEDYALGDTEIIGRSHYEVFPEIPQRWKDIHQRCLAGAVEKCDEDQFPRADGRLDWVRWQIHPWYTFEGEIGGVIMFTEVITEEKRAQDAIRRSESKYRALVEQASDGIFVTDASGSVIEANSEACRMLDYAHEDLLALNVNDLLVPGGTDFLADQRPELEAGNTVLVEVNLTHRDGSLLPVEVSARMLPDGSTQSIARDITERKRLERELREQEEQLLQAQKMEAVGRLAGGVAHDFNNLLTAIEGYCDLLVRKLGEDSSLLSEVQHIQKAATLAASVTRKLLAFSRKQIFNPEVVDVNAVVTGMERMLRRIIGEDIDVHAALAADLQPVKADPQHIEQVLLNLVLNARDAMGAGGSLRIATSNVTLQSADCAAVPGSRPGSFIRLAVEDTGCGISAEVLERVFEPFFTTKGAEHGTGLGLSTAYGIVKQHGGWITVRSEVGKGSCFEVYLPTTGEQMALPAAPAATVRAFIGRGERILLVEDEDIVREFAVKALTIHGYSVFPASNAKEAARVFQEEEGRFGLIFSDMVLPDKAGVDLIEELLARRPDIPVICTSGYTDSKAHFAMIREKGFRFLPKPYSMAKLVQTVSELVRSGCPPAGPL